MMELGNLPPNASRLVEEHKRMYRERFGLPEDAEVVYVPGSTPGTAYLYQPESFVRHEGGQLDLDAYRSWPFRLRCRARRALGWLRYGWRWWDR